MRSFAWRPSRSGGPSSRSDSHTSRRRTRRDIWMLVSTNMQSILIDYAWPSVLRQASDWWRACSLASRAFSASMIAVAVAPTVLNLDDASCPC
eukprot:symbB.v1.2.031485.t1/scaffold3662.1/size52420/1